MPDALPDDLHDGPEGGVRAGRGSKARTWAPLGDRSQFQRWLVGVWVLLCVLGLLIGAGVHLQFRSTHLEQGRKDLDVVSDLATRRVANWVDERMADARMMAENSGYALRVAQFLEDPQDAVNTTSVRGRLESENRYHHFSYIQVFDPAGTLRMSVPETRSVDTSDPETIAQVFGTPLEPVFGEMQVVDGGVEVDITVPLADSPREDANVVAVCVLHANVAERVFPMLHDLPGMSGGGEVLLLRPLEDGYETLSPRGSDAGGPYRFYRTDYDASDGSLSRADFERAGVFSAVNYDGRPVETSLSPIEGTSWVLQTTMDRGRLMAPVVQHLAYVAVLVFAWMLIVSLATGLIWRTRQFEHAVDQARIEYTESRSQELEALNRELEQANAVKNTFLANMSHELRTPLNSIIGFSGILGQGMAGPLSPEQLRQVRMINASGKHLLTLINDVLDLSKIEADRMDVERSVFDPGDVLREVAALLQPIAREKEVGLNIALPDERGTIESDAGKIRQILLNLVGNALKFTAEGHVDVSLNCNHDETFSFVVSDTGPGISPDAFDLIFEPFTQVGPTDAGKAAGTGLGLTLSRSYAQMIGGDIRVESEPGVGSTFTFTLPVTCKAAEEPQA